MSNSYDIVVCGSLVPDPLQTLEPLMGPDGPALKNEMMLPAVLDPWAGHALYEAANLAKNNPGSKVYLVSVGPKAKLQQLMMAIAQKVGFELVVVDGSASGFTESFEVAKVLADAIENIEGLNKEKMFLFGGCASASRDASVTIPLVAEMLGIKDLFMSVDYLETDDSGFSVKERVEGGKYLVSKCSSLPMAIGWATGALPEPPNNPQVGMMNMRTIMPALQKATTAKVAADGVTFEKVEIPSQVRDTRVESDMSVDDIAKELAEWIKG